MSDELRQVPKSEHNRLAALDQTELLDTPPQAFFDSVTRLVCKLTGAETALFSLVTDTRQFFKSCCGLDAPLAEVRETPLSQSLCRFVVESDEPLVIADARKIPDLVSHGAITELGVIAYLGVPIHAPDGHVIGSLCALSKTPQDWSQEDVSALQDLAMLVDEDLQLRAVARHARDLSEEKAILAREYHHRVKNALAVSSSLVRMSALGATSVDEVISAATGRLIALANAHDQLMNESDNVDLYDLSAKLLRPYCTAGSQADVDGPRVKLVHKQVTPICYFLHELATNSAKYGAFNAHGRVALRWVELNSRVELIWSEELANNSNPAPQGFGGTLLKAAAAQLRGTLKTDWSEKGLTVTLSFPH